MARTRETSPGCPKADERAAEGYLAWHDKAERLAADRVKQIRCARCRLWTWPDERCELFAPAADGQLR